MLLHDSLPGFSFPVRLTSVQPGLAHWKKIQKTMRVKATLGWTERRRCVRRSDGNAKEADEWGKKGARARVCVCGQRWPLKYILVANPATAAQVPRRKRTPPLDSQYNRRQNWQSADFFFLFFLSRWWISFSCCNAARKSAHPNTVKLNKFCFPLFFKIKKNAFCFRIFPC